MIETGVIFDIVAIVVIFIIVDVVDLLVCEAGYKLVE